MGIKVSCPHCDESYTVPEAKEGKTVRCRNCDEKIVVSRGRRSFRDEDEDDMEPRERRRSRGRRDPDDYEEDDRPRRRSRSGGVPAWAWVLGGGGVAAVFLVVLLIVLLNKGDKGGSKDTGTRSGGSAGRPGNPGGNPVVPIGGNSGPVVPSVETFARLKYDMSEQNVIAIFGQPTSRIERGLGARMLTWEGPGHPRLLVVIDPRNTLVKAILMSGESIIANLRVRPQ